MRIFWFCCLFFSFSSWAKPTVILLSIDGFAHDYLSIYPLKNIKKLITNGLVADSLLPVFPSKTFPNHLSIATGDYPIKHGIIHNVFYNRDLKKRYYLGAGKTNSAWLTATPIWIYAQQQGMKSAVYFWPESEAKVQGRTPNYFKAYNKNTPNISRVDQIIDWLKLPEKLRPQFIAGYFSLVDSAGHHYGKNSLGLKQAINQIDKIIGILVNRLAKEVDQKIDLIIVSDHGMTQLNNNAIINWRPLIPKNISGEVINGQTQLLIYSNDQKMLTQMKKQFKQNAQGKYDVYQQGEFPQHWHWHKQQQSIPDLIVDANPPYIFKSIKGDNDKATHGYDAKKTTELNAIFIANGSNFKAGKSIKAFENIDVFPLICKLLNIDIPSDVDGNAAIFTPYLIENK